MKNLDLNETTFYSLLLEDYIYQQKNAFTECVDYMYFIFHCVPFTYKDYSDIHYQNLKIKYSELIDNSDIIFITPNLSYIGKYKNFFWSCNCDGNIKFIGKKIMDIANHCNPFFKNTEKQFYDDMQSFFSCHKVNWQQYFHKFEKIAKDNEMKISFGDNSPSQLDLREFIEATKHLRLNIQINN